MANTATTMPGEERLSKRNLWGYSMGGIGRDMVYQLVNTSLMTFALVAKGLDVTGVLGITLIFLCCRIFDGLNDPLMGAIIEKTRTRLGKFKPWMMIGMITNIAVVISIFFVPLKGTEFVIFFAFAYLLWGITYTMNDISYWGMMPSLSSNPTDRNNLSTLANIGAGLGAGLAIGATSLLCSGNLAIQLFGSVENAYKVFAGIICVLFATCQTMTFFVVKEKPLPPLTDAQLKEKETRANYKKELAAAEKAKKAELKKAEKARRKAEKDPNQGLMHIFKVVFNNKETLAVVGAMLFYNVGSQVLLLFTTYWIWLRFGYYGFLATLFQLLTALTAVIIVFYPMMSKKFTRKQIMKISFATICIGYTLMFVIGLTTGFLDLPFSYEETGGLIGKFNGTGATLAFFFTALSGTIAFFGQTLFYQVLTVSIANTVEYNDYLTGSRDEGAIFACRPFMAKIGSAIGVGIQYLGLAVLGVIGITNQISDIDHELTSAAYSNMSDEALELFKAGKLEDINNILADAGTGMHQGLIVFMSIVPLIFIIVSFIIYMKKYTIDEVKYEEICNAIAARNAAANGEDVTVTDEAVADEIAIELDDVVAEETAVEDDVFDDAIVEDEVAADAPTEE